jgi:hypothetical protein
MKLVRLVMMVVWVRASGLRRPDADGTENKDGKYDDEDSEAGVMLVMCYAPPAWMLMA